MDIYRRRAHSSGEVSGVPVDIKMQASKDSGGLNVLILVEDKVEREFDSCRGTTSLIVL